MPQYFCFILLQLLIQEDQRPRVFVCVESTALLPLPRQLHILVYDTTREHRTLAHGEVYLGCANIRPQCPASFPDVLRAPSVRCKPEDFVVQVLRRVVAVGRGVETGQA